MVKTLKACFRDAYKIGSDFAIRRNLAVLAFERAPSKNSSDYRCVYRQIRVFARRIGPKIYFLTSRLTFSYLLQVTPLSAYRIFLPRHALAVEINHKGHIVGSLQDPGAARIGAVSEAFEYNNTIYIGHFESRYLGALSVPLIRSCDAHG